MSDANLLLALDLGTTTLAGRLLEPGGRVLAEAQRPNPQRALGGDVITRLERSRAGEGGLLQALLAEGISLLAADLIALAALPLRAIGRAAAAGNPAICHLLLGLPAEPLLFPPHRPASPLGEAVETSPLGFELPVPLYLFPLVSGFVGGDLLAFLFSREPHPPESFYLDVGTNGEMALLSAGRWWVTSVAAGPAFEGGGLACGMPWGPGAVEGVALDGERLRLTVAGGGLPRGICGTGLVEAVAAALGGGLIDRSGTLRDPLAVPTNLARHIAETPRGRSLRLYRDAAVDLQISQEELRAFQLAKGAIRAGAECLLTRAGLSADGVSEAVVTGAFGFRLAREALKGVAMLPPNMVDKVRFVGSGALDGVARMLLDPAGLERVSELAARLKPYPLSGTPAFEKAFLASLDF